MKKTAILAVVAAMPAFAGDAAPVVTVPAPEAACTAPCTAVAPAAAAAASCCAVELAGGYNFAHRDLYRVGKSVDTYGADLTLSHSCCATHSVNCRFGYTYGSDRFHTPGNSLRSQVETLSIMPGYRFTKALCDTTSVFAGVNVGAVRMVLDEKNNTGMDNDSDWGLAASAELGLSKKLCDKVSVFASYRLSGNKAKPCTAISREKIKNQLYSGINAGLSIKF